MMMTLDHVTIRTTDLEASREFFIDVFDLEERERPKAIQRIPGHWLYAGDEPLVHLIGNTGQAMPPSGDAIDHVGIRLEGYEAFKKKLDSMEIGYSLMDLEELNERRIFFLTPGRVLLEAVFREEG